MGAPETSCAPNAQQSTQAAPSAATAGSDRRRWPAATRVRRSTARVGRTSAATPSSTAPTTARFASVRPNDVAQRLDADGGVAPVVDGIERPVEGREEAEVEELHEHQQAERRPDHPGHDAPGAGRAGRAASATTTMPSSGSLTNAPGVRRPGWFGATRATHTSRRARIASRWSRRRASARDRRSRTDRATRRGRRSRRWRHSHQTSRPNDSASRASATARAARVRAGGRTLRRRDRQRDPLCRRDDLAPVARRQRRAHPAEQPPGREERVARCADREHPARRPRGRRTR